MASLLPLPDGSEVANLVQGAVDGWPEFERIWQNSYPRSLWLFSVEAILRHYFPQSSSRDRKLTARHYAPFPLAAGHDVP